VNISLKNIFVNNNLNFNIQNLDVNGYFLERERERERVRERERERERESE
jgi:hypothetical protein